MSLVIIENNSSYLRMKFKGTKHSPTPCLCPIALKQNKQTQKPKDVGLASVPVLYV